MPNLNNLTKALFGEDAIFLDRKKAHLDTSTGEKKFADGLVWRPWKRELWLVEVEWQIHNLDFQIRAFQKGKHNRKMLESDLRSCLRMWEDVLQDPLPQGFREYCNMPPGWVLDDIVRQTIENHFNNDKFRPFFWLILGHDSNNINKLLEEYTEDVTNKFSKFVISSIRMFESSIGAFLLIEQNKYRGLKLTKSILVPSNVMSLYQPEVSLPELPTDKEPIDQMTDTVKGQANVIWVWLSNNFKDLRRENICLRIKLGEKYEDFDIDWEHSGSLMVFYKDSHQYPAAAAKAAMPDIFPEHLSHSNISRKYGWLVDKSTFPPKVLAKYREIEFSKWRRKKAKGAEITTNKKIITNSDKEISNLAKQEFVDNKVENFFQRVRRKERESNNAQKNIIGKTKLWEKFIEQGCMSKIEMKKFGVEGKGSSGFYHFLSRNLIARPDDKDIFILNQAAVPFIKQLLSNFNISK